MAKDGYRTGNMIEEAKPSYESAAYGGVDSDSQEKGVPGNVGYKGKADPFGDESNAQVKYKIMTWWQAGMVMIAETISLGILSLPSVLATVGFLPGMLLIFGLGLLATYTGYTIGQFKMKYPHVHNMADAGEVMFGAFGRELFGAAQILLLVFNMGSHILTFSIMMNTVTSHGTCTIVFGVVGTILCFICTLPRKLGDVSYMSIASFISITAAVTITMVGVGITKPGKGLIDATTQTSFREAFLAVTNIIFAYAGHVAFFSFISELRVPEDYPKTLYLLQGVDTSMYLIVAAITYNYAGKEVVSPALGSASPLVSKVAYGIAIPTIIIAGVINGHVASKYIYVRMFRGTGMMSQKTIKSYGSWALIALTLWIIAWIIAEAIPTFNDLLSLISALFASWFTYGLSGIFWLYINKGRYTENAKKMALTALNVVIVAIGAVIMGLGLWASGVAIHQDASQGASFSCADNTSSG